MGIHDVQAPRLASDSVRERRSAGKASPSQGTCWCGPSHLSLLRPEGAGDPLKESPKPPAVILWWESLEVWQQLAISFPVLAVFTFLLNLGPFNQPLFRSVFYGLFEGAVLSGLMAVATRTERDRRR